MVAMKGLFGKKKRNPFAPADPMAMPGSPHTTMPQTAPMSAGYEQMPVNDPKAGLGTRLFGQGWENKAFALGGILRGDPTGAYMMRQDQQAEQQARAEAAAAQMERAQSLADWKWKEDYKSQNAAPDAFERTLRGAGIDPASPEGQELYKERAASMAGGQDEFVVVPIPGVGTYAGPRSGLAEAMGNGPAKPVGKLTPMGGPTQPASGGF